MKTLLPPPNRITRETAPENNKLKAADFAAHHWYRFVLSFPPHLVRDYIERFKLNPHHCVLDPFCGTGMTLVECKKLGIPSTGVESNPMACFASRVKVNWNVDPDSLMRHARKIADLALERLEGGGIDDEEPLPLFRTARRTATTNLKRVPEETQKLLLKDSISSLPLHKTLVLLETLKEYEDERYSEHERLALAKAVVFQVRTGHP